MDLRLIRPVLNLPTIQFYYLISFINIFIHPVLNSPSNQGVKRAKIKRGRNFPCIQYLFSMWSLDLYEQLIGVTKSYTTNLVAIFSTELLPLKLLNIRFGTFVYCSKRYWIKMWYINLSWGNIGWNWHVWLSFAEVNDRVTVFSWNNLISRFIKSYSVFWSDLAHSIELILIVHGMRMNPI